MIQEQTNAYRQNVMGILINDKKEVLIIQYTASWTRNFPKWGLQDGEDYETWIYRELEEELWVQTNNLAFLFAYTIPFRQDFTQEQIERKIKNKGEYYKWKEEKMLFFRYTWDNSDINHWVSPELSASLWIGIDKIPEYIKNESFINLLDLDFLKKLLDKIV